MSESLSSHFSSSPIPVLLFPVKASRHPGTAAQTSPKEAGPACKVLLAAVGTTAFGIPVRRWLISRRNFDSPNHRSSHTTPVPRGGGIAAILGSSVALLTTGTPIDLKTSLSVGALALVGWLDDVSGDVHPSIRLLAQAAVGAWGLANQEDARVLGAITTAGVVNSFNFMDGINGISGMTAVVWGANAMAMEDEGPRRLQDLGALTAGAGLGFLPHNIPAARMFLGDVGSYGFGAAMAAGVLSQRTHGRRYQAAAPLIIYAADVAQAIVVRAINGDPIGAAHRDHIYQRLVDQGIPHHWVALLHAVLAAVTSCASRRPRTFAAAITAGAVAAYYASPWMLSSQRRMKTRPA